MDTVYALVSSDEQMVKVGFSSNLPLRMAVINSACRTYRIDGVAPVELLYLARGNRKTEQELHRKLKSFRVEGRNLVGIAQREWFRRDSRMEVGRLFAALRKAPVPESVCRHGLVRFGSDRCSRCPVAVSEAVLPILDGSNIASCICGHSWPIRKKGGARRCPRCQKPRGK